MSLHIGRLDQYGDNTGGFAIIAAIPTKTVTNGHTEYVVTAYDETRREYATWRMGWTYSDDDDSTRTYTKMYSSGNYFKVSLTRPNAREEALSDMITRAGLLPAINGTADLDIPPHKPQPLTELAEREIALLWPAQYTSGVYYTTQGQKRTIYNFIRTGRKIQAIKEWRSIAGTTRESGYERSNMDLLTAKRAVEAVQAHFESFPASEDDSDYEDYSSRSGCDDQYCGVCYPNQEPPF